MESLFELLKLALGLVYCSFGLVLTWVSFAGLRLFSLKPLTLSETEQKDAQRVIESYPVTHKKIKCSSGHTISFVVKSHEKAPKGTILFIHGFPNYWYLWRDYLIHYYHQGYDVIAVNTRGNGDSSKPIDYKSYHYQSITGLKKYFKNMILRIFAHFIFAKINKEIACVSESILNFPIT